MKKEVFLAIFIGFILGLIITFGIWTANKSLRQLPTSPEAAATESSTPDSQVSPTSSPSSDTNSAFSLTLTSPDDELLTNTDSVTLAGKTKPNIVVSLLYELGSTTQMTDSSGSFSFEVPLEGGYNTLTVVATDSDGNQATSVRTVTYTTSKI